MAFMDGHVENMRPVDNGVPLYDPNSNPWGWPAAANQFRTKNKVFDLSVNDGIDTCYNNRL